MCKERWTIKSYFNNPERDHEGLGQGVAGEKWLESGFMKKEYSTEFLY